jgi:hypothetical protein
VYDQERDPNFWVHIRISHCNVGTFTLPKKKEKQSMIYLFFGYMAKKRKKAKYDIKYQ